MASEEKPLETIFQFIKKSSGLQLEETEADSFKVLQKVDGRHIRIAPDQIEEVMVRVDSMNIPFLQVNFWDGKKILLTEKLIGFKPVNSIGLDIDRLPRVVTTPDLVSVIEAIEESLSSGQTHPDEVQVLKKVFDAVLRGGEDIGFDLQAERAWLNMICSPLKTQISV